MKYCTHCGKQLLDEAVLCPGCGCSVVQNEKTSVQIIASLAQRLYINGVIWLVVGILQVLMGLYVEWIFIVVGALNIASASGDMQYSRSLRTHPSGIVSRFRPLFRPIIVMIYNLFFGGVIGVGGSLYYFIAVRGFVMENRDSLSVFDRV